MKKLLLIPALLIAAVVTASACGTCDAHAKKACAADCAKACCAKKACPADCAKACCAKDAAKCEKKDAAAAKACCASKEVK